MHQILKLGLALAFLLSSSCSVLAEEPIILTSGDTGKITLPVANNPLSVGPATNVQVTYSAPPAAKFQVLPTSQLQAASIAPGTTFVFVVDYEIGSDPADGPFDLTLTVSQGNPDAYLDVDPNTSVSVMVDGTAPKLEVADEFFIPLESGDITDTGSVLIDVSDFNVDEPGSGIAYVSLECQDFKQERFFPEPPATERPQDLSFDFPMGGGALPEGLCTLTARDAAGNESVLDFFVQREAMALYDEDDRLQSLYESPDLPPDTHWSRANKLKFSMSHGDGIAAFSLLRGAGQLQEIVLIETMEDEPTHFQVTLSSSTDGHKLIDSREVYTARMLTRSDLTIERFFVLDRTPPKVDITDTMSDPVAQSLVVTGAYHDSASGVATVARITNPTPGDRAPDYGGDTWPPGDAVRTIGGTLPPGRYFHAARDLSGLDGAIGPVLAFQFNELPGNSRAEDDHATSCNRTLPGLLQPFFFGNGGNILVRAAMTMEVGFVNPSYQQAYDAGHLAIPTEDIGKAELLLQSESPTPPASPMMWTVRNSIGATSETAALSFTSPGAHDQDLNIPLAPVVTARIGITPRLSELRGTLTTFDEDGASVLSEITIPPHGVFPRGVRAECTFRSATIDGLDEDNLISVPASPTLNARFDLEGIYIEADEITSAGALRVGITPFAPPPELHPTSAVWDVSLSAGYRPPLRIGISHEKGVWPADLLAKTSCWRISEEGLEGLGCEVDSDHVEATTPGTSLFFSAIKDGLPPRSSLAYAGTRFELPDGGIVVSPRTSVSLSAYDPVENGHVDTGVIASYMKKDSAFVSTSDPDVERVAGQPLPLAEGITELFFKSEDFVHNLEALQHETIAVDGTPPATEFSATTPFETNAAGDVLLPADAKVVLTAADPLSNGVRAGVGGILALIDVTPEACGFSEDSEIVPDLSKPAGTCANPFHVAPLEVPTGQHDLWYAGFDNVRNVESFRSKRIQKQAPPPDPRVTPYFEPVLAFGSYGADPGQFDSPIDVAAGRNGEMFVSDGNNRRIQKFDAQGKFLRAWGSAGGDPGQFGAAPEGLSAALDADGHLWVADPGNQRVQKFTQGGEFVSQLGPFVTAPAPFNAFRSPVDVAAAPDGSVYVLDNLNGTVSRFSASGAFLGGWAASGAAITVAPGGEVYVLSSSQLPRVKRYSATGALLAQWGSSFGGNQVRALDADAYGNIYIGDSYRFLVFTESGNALAEFGTRGSLPGQFDRLLGLGVDRATGRILTTESLNRVQVFAVDVTPPSAPVLIQPFAGSRIVSSDAPMRFFGRAEPRSTVEIREGTTLLASTRTDAAGYFSAVGPLVNLGPHVVSARALSAGMESAVTSIEFSVVALNPPTFTDPFLLSNKFLGTYSAASADFNRDGKPDIAISGASGLVVHLGLGDGRFGTATYGTPWASFSLVAADLDGDGFADLVGGAYSPAELLVAFGRGDGTFEPTTRVTTAFFAGGVAVADFNEDGRLDVAVLSQSSSQGPIALHLGLGGRSFAPPSLTVLPDTATVGGWGMAAGDIDGDSHVDLLAGHVIAWGRGDGSFAVGTVLPIPEQRLARGAALPDLNRDGRPDVAFIALNGSSWSESTVESFLNLGDRRFVPSGSASAPYPGTSLKLGDFNSDGLPDVIASQSATADAIAHLGHGDGSLGDPVTLASLGIPYDAVPADYDGDGQTDVFLALQDPYTNSTIVGAAFLNRSSPVDLAAPSSVALAATLLADGSARLAWTAPGDDGQDGRAATYDLRRREGAPIADAEAFAAATAVPGLTAPQASGSAESYIVADLPGGTNVYFALRALDEAGNAALISNSPSLQVPFVARSDSLVDGAPEVLFLSQSVPVSVQPVDPQVGATALGKAGEGGFVPVSNIFDLGPEETAFSPAATLAFRYSPEALAELGILESEVALYHFDLVEGWTFVEGQTRDEAADQVRASFSSVASIFAVLAKVEDTVPPITRLLAASGGNFADDAGFYASSTATFILEALDPVARGTATGVAFSEYRVISASFTRFTGPFNLAEGAHLLEYRSQDGAGNLETLRSTMVRVDGTPPVTVAAFEGSTAALPGHPTVLGASSRLRLDSQDPVVLGAAAGVEAILVAIGTATPSAYLAPIAFPEGEATFSFSAIDRVGNHEVVRSTSILVDARAPTLAIVSPAGGERFLGSRSTITVDYIAADNLDPAPVVEAMLIQSEDHGAPRGLRPDRVRVSAGQVLDPGVLDDGLWELHLSAVDFVANVASAAGGAFEVIHDVLPPRSTLALREPAFVPSSGGITFITGATPVVLTSVDDLLVAGDAFGVGVAVQMFGIDASSPTEFVNPSPGPGPFVSTATLAGIADGLHVLTLSARDGVGSAETVSIATVAVDNTSPVTQLAAVGPMALAPEHQAILASTTTVFRLVAEDPLVNGVASGVHEALLGLDGAELSPSSGPFSLPEGVAQLAYRSLDQLGNTEPTRAATVIVDSLAPTLRFAIDVASFPIPGGFATLASSADVTLSVEDLAAGLAWASYVVDGQDSAFSFSSGTLRALAQVVLGPGLHQIVLRASDRLGHTGELAMRIAVGDTRPPATSLLAGAPQATLSDGSVLVAAQTPLSLAAEDFAESDAPSGVAETRYRFTPSEFGLYGDPFTAPAPDGPKDLEFFSTDRAGNVELPAKSARLVRDGAPPLVALAKEPTLCRLTQGALPLRGSVADPHLASWGLTQGALRVGSGTAAVDGLLGVWEPAGQSGAFDLTLSAADLVQNSTSVTMRVYAGAPARSLALGGKGALNKPRGVATAEDRIYVADTNADVVRVYDALGNSLAAFGKLNKPAGLAVNALGAIYVADRNNKRVVKLSPSGVLLREFGGKGVLEKPVAVALAAGKVFVADARNGQVVVFSEAGGVLARVDLPPAAGPDEDPDEPRPMALAADAAGNMWVADGKGGRALRYDADLRLAQTIAGFTRPEGVAVSQSGACLAVADAKEARVRTFDASTGAELAAFGNHGEVKENKPLPTEFFLNRPAQLAFTADGALLVADRNNDLVQGFGLPGTPVVVAVGTPGRSGGGSHLASSEGGEGEVVASVRVGRFEGGRVEHPDGAAVEIPAGSVTEDVDVAVAIASDASDEHRAREAGRSLAGLAAASAAREFSPHGLTFSEPARITLPYDPLLAAAARALKIHYWNPERGTWEALDSNVDEGAHTVSAHVAHFSIYQILAPAGAFSTLADPETGFAFRAIYAFPNPAVGGQRPTVHVAVGRADKVVVRFYDVAGTPVHEATLDAPSVVNDESGPHLAYEYAWTGHIPSGIYIYAVTAEKAGHAPIKRVGKLAVVR